MDRALDRAHETRPHTNPTGTKSEARHEAACIRKATGGDQRDLQHIGRRRDQNESRDIVFAWVPRTFEAVDRNHVHSHRLGLHCMADGRTLVHDLDAMLLELAYVLERIVASGLDNFDTGL